MADVTCWPDGGYPERVYPLWYWPLALAEEEEEEMEINRVRCMDDPRDKQIVNPWRFGARRFER